MGWHKSWPPGWARRVVKRGLKWKWGPQGPPPLLQRRPQRAIKPSIQSRVAELLADGVVEPAQHRVFLSRLFEVPKRDSMKTRLVLDVSRLNLHIPPYKFKMTTISSVRQTLRPGWFLASIDLKDAYWHVPIAKAFRPFLAFSAGQRNYQFRVLPFGLNIAPRVFTKVLRPVHARLATMGVNIMMYLDDWLVFAPTRHDCAEMVRLTLQLGSEMGLAFNLEKSSLHPTQTLQWLGMSWDTTHSTLALSRDNQLRCKKQVFRALHSSTLTRRQWESLMGSLNHASLIIPLGRLRARRLIFEGSGTFRDLPRDSPVPFPRRLKNLLQWWSKPGRLSHTAAWTAPAPFLTLTTDASDRGWGYQSSRGHQGQGTWLTSEATHHINSKELATVWKALELEEDLREGTISVLTDSTTVVHCLNKQGTVRSASLLRLSETILEEAHRRQLTITATHLAGVSNSWADALSRGSSSTIEWSLTPACFASICTWAGTPEVDLFASQSNHRLPLFLSLTEETSAGGPDALRTPWDQWDFVYLFPPPNTRIMIQVARRLELYQGRALLIAPHWETQPWFSTLRSLRPSTRPLPQDALLQETACHLMKSLRLTAWLFSA